MASKLPSVAEILKEAKKKYDLSVGPISSLVTTVESITTGNMGLDYAIGCGGFPRGRLTELYGVPASGKTTTALQVAAEYQKRIIAENLDEYIAYFDYEHALDRTYAAALGLDVDHSSFLFAQPDSLEQGASVATALVSTGKVGVLIFDSVAAMTPADELASEVSTGGGIALQARLLAQFLKKLISLLHANNALAIFLNHEKEVMAMGGGGKPGVKRTTTPGGTALKFYASVRVSYQQIGNVKGKVYDPLLNVETEQVESTNVRIKVVKNKVGPPFREAIVRVRFGRGFDNFWTAFTMLSAHRQIQPAASGYWYFDKDTSLAHEDMPRSGTDRPYLRGEPVLMKFADDHPEWRDLVVATGVKFLEGLSANSVPSPVEEEEDSDSVLSADALDDLLSSPMESSDSSL